MITDGLCIDARVARVPTLHDLFAASRMAHRMGFRYLSWLYLMECEVRHAV